MEDDDNENTFISLATAIANVVSWLSSTHHHAGKREHEQDESGKRNDEEKVIAASDALMTFKIGD